MNYCFTTYANLDYKIQQDKLQTYTNSLNSFSTIISYTEQQLKFTDFYKENKTILDLKRGAGYWLWKPFIILESMKVISEDDVVFYLDCGDFFNKEIINYTKPILEKEVCLLLGGGYQQKNWTKRDCFYYMDCQTSEYTETIQLEAGIQFWKKTPKSIEILEEQIKFCKNYRILTDSPNECGLSNYPNFQDHRHDQSVLTNLFVKYQLPVDSLNHKTPYKQMRNYVKCNVVQ